MATPVKSSVGWSLGIAALVVVVALTLATLLFLDGEQGRHADAVRRAPAAVTQGHGSPVESITPAPPPEILPDGVEPLSAEPGSGQPTEPPAPTTLREGAEVLSLSGRVVDGAGAPVAGAELRFGVHSAARGLSEAAWADPLRASHRDQPARGVHSDAEGRFTLFVDAAHLRTQSNRHGWVLALASDYAVLAHRTPELLVEAVDLGELRLAPGTSLTARTVGLDGRPLADVELRLDALLPARPEDLRSGVRLAPHVDEQRFDETLRAALRTTSDHQGRVRLNHLPEGAARLRFAHDDHAALLLPELPLTFPGPVTLGDVVLDPGGSIAGRLLDPQGQPVVGGFAAVFLRDDGSGRDAEAARQAGLQALREDSGEAAVSGRTRAKIATDEQGRFAFSGLAQGWYELSVTAAHHAWDHHASVATGSTELRLTLPAPGTLQLDVTDALTGEPIPEPQVSVSLPPVYRHLQGGVRWGHEVSHGAGGGGDPQPGLVTVLGIGMEGALLTVSAPGYASFSGEEGPVPAGAVITRAIQLEPGLHLAGVVLDERDEPIEGARLRLTHELDPRRRDAISDGEGRFRIDDLQAGDYTFDARGPGLLESSSRVPFTLLASRDDVLVRLDREAVLTGLVLDARGQPAPGWTVLAWPLWPTPADTWERADPRADLTSYQWRPVPTAPSDADGRYHLARMVPGEYAVFATAEEGLADDLRRKRWNALPFEVPGHALRVDVAGGLEIERDLTLPPSTSVVGDVREGERPAAGANVSLFVPQHGHPAWRMAASTLCDEDGHYELRDLEPGPHLAIVQVRAGSFPVTRRLELRADVTTRHDVTTGGGIVRGVVVERGSGLPLADVRVIAGPEAQDDSPWMTLAGFTTDTIHTVSTSPSVRTVDNTTDAAGRFELRDLPPGQVGLQTQGGGTLPGFHSWSTLSEDEPLELTLEVERGARVEGRLTHRDGAAVDPQAVLLQLREPLEDALIKEAYLENGAWAFESLEGGRYEVHVIRWDDDAVLLRESVNVSRGATAHLDLLLDA